MCDCIYLYVVYLSHKFLKTKVKLETETIQVVLKVYSWRRIEQINQYTQLYITRYVTWTVVYSVSCWTIIQFGTFLFVAL